MNVNTARVFVTALWLTAGVRSISPVVLSAQSDASTEPRKSQARFVSQAVATTTISVKYIRPVARGRELFGGIVKWDKEWTPSADSAALLTVSKPIQMNGVKLEAGTYGFAPPAHSATRIRPPAVGNTAGGLSTNSPGFV